MIKTQPNIGHKQDFELLKRRSSSMYVLESDQGQNDVKTEFRENICIGGGGNSVPIPPFFNTDPYAKTKFHQDVLKW